MKIKHLLTKTLLVAAGLLLGAGNVWGTDTKVTLPCTNSITIVGTKSYGDDGSAYTDLFRLNSYAGEGGAGAIAFTLDNDWDASKVKNAILKIYPTSKCNKNRSGNIYIKSISSYPDLSSNESTSYGAGKHIVYKESSSTSKRYTFSGTTQATIAASAYTSGTPAQGAYYDIDLTTYIQGLTTKSPGDLIYFGIDVSDWALDSQFGAYGNTNAPKLEITYTSETLYTATFTETNSLNPTVTIYSNSEMTSPVVNGTLTNGTTYYYKAVLEGYEDYTGSFTVSSANPSIDFTMTVKPAYSINAVSGGTTLSIIAAGYASVSATYSTYISKYVLYNGNYYVLDDDGNTNLSNYLASYTMGNSGNEVKEINYTLVPTVVFFSEWENSTQSISNTGYYTSYNASTMSGGWAKAVQGNANRDLHQAFTIATAATYLIEMPYYNSNASTREYVLYLDGTDEANKLETKSISGNNGGTFSKEVELTAGSHTIYLKENGATLTPQFDYLTVTLVSVPATIGSTGYTTFASPYALNLSGMTPSEGTVKAYYVTASDVKSSSVSLTEATGNVAAGTGLILEGTDGAAITIPVVASGTDLSSTNMLVGCPTGATITAIGDYANFYVLGATTATFKNIKNYVDTNTSLAIPAGKAYLDTTGSAVPGAPSLTLDLNGEVTGIADVRSKMEEVRGDIFDLQGRKVAQPQKGLYIQNGRKVILK